MAVTAPLADATSRDAILDAAEQLFAARGLAATTVKQIGAAARVNSALLYYYFPSKEALYDAVLDRLVGGFVAAGGVTLDHARSPHDAVRALIEWQARALSARPQLPRLLARELADHGARHAEGPLTGLAARLFSRLCDVIKEGQRQHLFRADVDPAFAAISTISQVAYAFIARPAVGILLGQGIDGPGDETLRDFARHAADFALAALDPSPRPPVSA